MFEKLDRYINEFEAEDFPVDYWYDEGFLIVEDMLQSFENDDWEYLFQKLPKKTIGWKRRLAYCLHDSNDLKQLEVLLMLIDTDDDELFEISVDSLRSFKDNLAIIQNDNQKIQKIETLMLKVGVATKRMFQEFLNTQ